MGKPEGKRALGRPTRRWGDNIKIDVHKVGCEGMDWIHLGQDKDGWRALVNAVMNLRAPYTYLLTPWSRVLLGKLTGSAASQEIPRIFGTRRFITVLPSARHLSLS